MLIVQNESEMGFKAYFRHAEGTQDTRCIRDRHKILLPGMVRYTMVMMMMSCSCSRKPVLGCVCILTQPLIFIDLQVVLSTVHCVQLRSKSVAVGHSKAQKQIISF